MNYQWLNKNQSEKRKKKSEDLRSEPIVVLQKGLAGQDFCISAIHTTFFIHATFRPLVYLLCYCK